MFISTPIALQMNKTGRTPYQTHLRVCNETTSSSTVAIHTTAQTNMPLDQEADAIMDVAVPYATEDSKLTLATAKRIANMAIPTLTLLSIDFLGKLLTYPLNAQQLSKIQYVKRW